MNEQNTYTPVVILTPTRCDVCCNHHSVQNYVLQGLHFVAIVQVNDANINLISDKQNDSLTGRARGRVLLLKVGEKEAF